MPTNSARSPIQIAAEASGLTVLVPADEMGQYQLHMSRITLDLQPETQTECELVQRIANAEWRLNKIARLEMAIFAAGRLEFAALFPEQEPEIRVLLIDRRTFQVYAGECKQLNLQESRLRRYLTVDRREYADLLKLREKTESAPAAVADPSTAPPAEIRPAAARTASASLGFEFSNKQDTAAEPAPTDNHASRDVPRSRTR